MKRLDKVENEVRWLNFMLNQVKDNGQGKHSELERRLTDVEGKSNKGGSA
jgi:archaellum component FlaC